MIRKHTKLTSWRRIALLLTLLVAFGSLSIADDRELVREGGRPPYLFVIFDVSGSMNWTPPMTGTPTLNPLTGLPDWGGDSWAPAYGDDPNSKFYQAKSALFRVMTDPSIQGGVRWGFANYNDDRVRVWRKHWLYTVSENTPVPWEADLPYPADGEVKTFGDTCLDDNDSNSSCDLDDDPDNPVSIIGGTGFLAGVYQLGTCGAPIDLGTLRGRGQILSFPVLGDTGSDRALEWIRWNGRVFAVLWQAFTGAMGDLNPVADVWMQEYDPATCTSISPVQQTKVNLETYYKTDNTGRPLADSNDVLFWQLNRNFNNRDGEPAGFFDRYRDFSTSNTCAGWDPNNDTSSDEANSRNLKWPTITDPDGRGTPFARGDVIPFDWRDEIVWPAGQTNQDAILRRLTPNWDPLDPAFVPEFRAARYFEDHPPNLTGSGANIALPLMSAYANTPPLIPNGSTPIGGSMANFKTWYEGWKPIATGSSGDPDFDCRSVNLVIITDGDETCGSAPCTVATQLLGQHDIRTFVIAFGLQSGAGNQLDCIAQNGGTDAIDLDGDGTIDVTGPIYPQNEQEFVDAMTAVIQSIKPRPRAFAAANAPPASFDAGDKVFLSSFTPIQDAPIWPGRFDAYLKPVPLVTVNVTLPDGTTEPRLLPNPNRSCGGTPLVPGLQSECHLWEAGQELLAQAPSTAQVAVGDYNFGTGANERRVYYSQEVDPGVPDDRLLLERPSDDAGWLDYFEATERCGDPLTNSSFATCVMTTGDPLMGRDPATAALDQFFSIKTVADPSNPGNFITYLLGDVFHSDPEVLGNPDNFRYWVTDAAGNGTFPLDDPCGISPDGYRCFFAEQEFRRKVALLGSNDNQLHAFDAGVARAKTGGACITPTPGVEIPNMTFDNGTGREVFAYVPRIGLPGIDTLGSATGQEFTIDGKVSSGDIFVDPEHTGTPNPDERDWRTAVMYGLREGGSGYAVLDLTQPDTLGTCNNTDLIPQPLGGSSGWVPSCTNGGSGCDAVYPRPMWEFTDTQCCTQTVFDTTGGALNKFGVPDLRCDEDGNGLPDLADTWSTSVIGRIQVEPVGGGTPIDKYVGVFGGGMDPDRKGLADAGGNYVYMVDMETGEIIYKRRVLGSVPSDIAIVDTNQDSYFDTMYFGTTAGFMYKVDLSLPQPLVAQPCGDAIVTSLDWEPFPIFDTVGRPIYFAPAVIFVAELGKYAPAFTTGDREDLWSETFEEGRFHIMLDTAFTRADYLSGTLPKVESDYQRVAENDPRTNGDFLQNAPFGWYIPLGPDERGLNQVFSFGGVTVFTTYIPDPLSVLPGTSGVCFRSGDSRTFVVNTTNANGLLPNDERLFTIEGGFLSSPFIESGQTSNLEDGTGGPTADDIPDNLKNVMDELKGLFPGECKFANFTVNIKAVRDDTGIEMLAAVPVCINPTNWKDF